MDPPGAVKSTQRLLARMVSVTSERLATMELTERFEVLGELGRGAYGQVVLAKQRDSGVGVALKLLPKERVPRDVFLLEFSLSLLLSAHPGIISTLVAAWQTASHYVFAQEVAPAGSLQSLLMPGEGIPEVLVKRCTLQISSALHYMHSLGLVHRDVKPDNVMLMDPECHCVKLSDFGLTSLTGFNIAAMSCTNPYMAPELCRLRDPDSMVLHPSIDVWALAVLMVTTLTGFFPWERALPSDKHYKDLYWWQARGTSTPTPRYWQQFTPEAQDCVKQMLTFDPQRRCTVSTVQQYLDVPWKTVSSESEQEEGAEQQRLQGRPEEVEHEQPGEVELQDEVHEETELYQEEAELYQEEAELYQEEAELYQEEAELHQEEAELHQEEAELYQEEAGLHQEEAELQQGEAELHQEEAELYHEEGELYQEEAELHEEVELHYDVVELHEEVELEREVEYQEEVEQDTVDLHGDMELNGELELHSEVELQGEVELHGELELHGEVELHGGMELQEEVYEEQEMLMEQHDELEDQEDTTLQFIIMFTKGAEGLPPDTFLVVEITNEDAPHARGVELEIT